MNATAPRDVVERRTVNPLAATALVLLIIGGLNWALVGLFGIDLVASLFGTLTPLSRIVYVLVGLAAVAAIVLFMRLARTP